MRYPRYGLATDDGRLIQVLFEYAGALRRVRVDRAGRPIIFLPVNMSGEVGYARSISKIIESIGKCRSGLLAIGAQCVRIIIAQALDNRPGRFSGVAVLVFAERLGRT